MINEYKKIFEKLKQFKKEQEKQKQRGLNNYNILTTVLKEHDEVRLHSRMIASFLDPSGEHYQSTLFLDKFLEVLAVPTFNIDSKKCSVYREYENIDLYITDGDKHIILENKVYAKDQERQIERYVKIINKENEDLDMNDILVVYLSLNRMKPSSYSLGDLSIANGIVKRNSEEIALFKSIHYKNEILKWLEVCQYEVQNITNLNEVFRQYIDVVKMINNQYKDRIMSLTDYITENESVYKLAIELQKELPKARKNIIDEFFNKIISSLQMELGTGWTVELIGNLVKKHNFPLRIYKEDWIGSKENNLIFGFEFDKNNYYDGYFGIVRMSNKIDIKGDISNKFKVDIKALSFKLKTDSQWLHWEWLPNIAGTDDLVGYVQFNEDSERKFLDGIMNLVRKFELDSNLMTDINTYLNTK